MTNTEKAEEISKHYSTSLYFPNDKEIAAYDAAIQMAVWKDQQFWSYENIEEIIRIYSSFPDRSCPGKLVKKTIEQLKMKYE